MLTIRRDQLEALESEARRRFEVEMIARLRAEGPETPAELTVDAIRETVRAAVSRALGYGIDEEASVAVFVSLCFERGLGFEEAEGSGPARAILEDASIPGAAKIVLLTRRPAAREG